jgi:hypothetical protein
MMRLRSAPCVLYGADIHRRRMQSDGQRDSESGVSDLDDYAGTTPARSSQAGDERCPAVLGRRMTKKLSVRFFYALVLTIVLLMIGFLGLGVRAFASAVISDSIYFAAFGVLLVTFPIYFVLHRPLAGTAIDRKIRRPSAVWSGQVFQHKASGLHDRRRPLVQGQKRAAVARERRSRQLAGFRVVNLEPIASETLRG